jgi:hypothetical protein
MKVKIISNWLLHYDQIFSPYYSLLVIDPIINFHNSVLCFPCQITEIKIKIV